jgi:gamma-glutamylputrescine oxidase
MRKNWWNKKNTEMLYGQHLPREIDIVILGAGLAGISAAYWLLASKKKLSILILDSGPFPGYKGTGRELGMGVICGGRNYKTLASRMDPNTARVYALTGRKNNQLLHRFINKNEIPCDYERSGGLRLSGCLAEQKDLRRSATLLNDIGVPCAILTEGEVLSIMPSNKVYGGLYIPCELSLNPFEFINFVSNRLKEAANVIFGFSAQVQEVVKPKRSTFRIVKLHSGHEIKAQYVIHANNESPRADWLIPFREHAIAGDDLPDNLCDVFPHMPLVVNDGYDYFRLYANNLLSSGSRFAGDSKGEAMVRNDNSYNPKVYESLSSNISKMFPVSNVVGHTHAWTFISYETPDGLPAIGRMGGDAQQFMVAGLGSHRFGIGFVAGRIVAEQIYDSNRGMAILGKTFSPSRFE